MDKKFYISFEVARLLKEKGYNAKCNFAYTDISNGSDINGRIVFNSNDYPVGIYPCPTKAEAIDWLESKGMVVEAFYTRHHWFFSIIDFNVKQKTFADEYYLTRLEAEEVAIIKALELL